MQLLFLNASPRGRTGNTEIMMNYFIDGFEEVSGNMCSRLYLLSYRKKLHDLVKEVLNAENVIVGFPLYVDAMPGSLKGFLEVLAGSKDSEKKPPLGFFSQCGFPETGHLRYVERYLEKYARRTGFPHPGSIMKGGGEGQHIQPEAFLQKTFSILQQLGREFGTTGKLDRELLAKFARPEHLSHDQIKGLIPFINDRLWDQWLRGNDALEKSFNRPYK